MNRLGFGFSVGYRGALKAEVNSSLRDALVWHELPNMRHI